MQLTAEEAIDRTLPEDSIQPARLEEIKTRTINWVKNGESRSAEILEWWWEITDGEYVGRRIKGESRDKLVIGEKLSNWAGVLLDTEIGAGFPLDTDDLIGLSANIVVGHRADKKDAAKVWEFVFDVLPYDGDVQSQDPPF